MTIKTKPATKEYRDNWDMIFSNGRPVRPYVCENPEEDFHQLMHSLATAWHYGGWKAETFNERLMQQILEDYGYWPYKEGE